MSNGKFKTAAQNNPVRTIGGALTAVASLITALVEWGLEALPASVPDDVRVAGIAAVVAALGWAGQRVGKTVQGRFTEPKAVLDNLIARMEGEQLSGSAYAQSRAMNETDPHGPELDDPNVDASEEPW